MPPPSPSPGRAYLAEFCSARSETIPPLPWTNFSPPFPPLKRRILPGQRRAQAAVPIPEPVVPAQQCAAVELDDARIRSCT